MSDLSEDQFRTRLLRHMTRRPEPARPADYRNESPRLLGELTDGIRAEDALGRGRLDARAAFAQMRRGDAAQELVGGLIDPPTQVAGDRDVFGAPMLGRAMDRVRRSGRPQPGADVVSARNTAALVAASEELELRASVEPSPQQVLKAREILAQYPDMAAEDAFALATAEDTNQEDE